MYGTSLWFNRYFPMRRKNWSFTEMDTFLFAGMHNSVCVNLFLNHFKHVCTREWRNSVYSNAERDSVEYEPNQWCFIGRLACHVRVRICIAPWWFIFFQKLWMKEDWIPYRLFSTFHVSHLMVLFLVPKFNQEIGWNHYLDF